MGATHSGLVVVLMRFQAAEFTGGDWITAGEGAAAATDCAKDAAVLDAVHDPILAVAVNAIVRLVDASELTWVDVRLVSTHQWSLAAAARVPTRTGTLAQDPVVALSGGLAQSPLDFHTVTVVPDASGEDAPAASETDVL